MWDEMIATKRLNFSRKVPNPWQTASVWYSAAKSTHLRHSEIEFNKWKSLRLLGVNKTKLSKIWITPFSSVLLNGVAFVLPHAAKDRCQSRLWGYARIFNKIWQLFSSESYLLTRSYGETLAMADLWFIVREQLHTDGISRPGTCVGVISKALNFSARRS